jgi:hypothetical protein
MPAGIQTTEPGTFITSVQYYSWGAVKECNKRDLSYLLMDVYTNSYSPSDPESAIAHVPFLTGKGWDLGGACRAEAEAICTGVGLTLVVDSGDPDGHVVTQISTPGELRDLSSLIPSDKEVHVTLSSEGDCAEAGFKAMSSTGDTWLDAISVEDADRDGTVKFSGSIGVDHTDTKAYPGSATDRSDLFFRLPTFDKLTTVTVAKEAGRFECLNLSAWTMKGDELAPASWGDDDTQITAGGYDPKLVIPCAPGVRYYVMVEFPTRDIGTVALRATW